MSDNDPDALPPLDTLPIDGVPIAAVRHIVLGVPPISPEANVVFMLACSHAWGLLPMPTIEDIEETRSASDDPDTPRRGLAELVERGLVTVDEEGQNHPTTGVPGSPPPPPADEVWAAHNAWIEQRMSE